MDNEIDPKYLTLLAYEKHGIKYSIYQGLDRFNGTAVPEGYEAVYINDGIIPDSLQLVKIKKETIDSNV